MRPEDSFPRSAPRQPHNNALQNMGVPLPVQSVQNGQLESHSEGMAHDQPGRSVARPGGCGLPDPRHIDVAYYASGMVDNRPLPLRDPPVPSVFPDVGVVQGIPAMGQPNVPENQEHDLLTYAPQHVPPFHAEAAFPDPFGHQIPAPGQPAAENLRRLAIRLLHKPDSQVDRVSMIPGAAGLCKVVIVLEMADVL